MKEKNRDINLIIYGVSVDTGMAGTKRIRNFLEYLLLSKNISVSNINCLFSKERIKKVIISKKQVNYVNICKRYLPFLNFFVSLILGLFYLAKYRKRKAKNILYCYGYPDIKNISHLFFARLIGFKIVFDIVEDNELFKDYKSYYNKLKLKSSIFFINHFFSLGSAFITITHHLQEKVSAITKGKVDTFLLPISIKVDDYPSGFTTKNTTVNMKIFYGGSFGKKDGVELLISAFNNLKAKGHNLELILTGKGSKRDEENIQLHIKNSPFKEWISFMGYLSDEEYYSALNNSDICCMTRVNTGYANAGFPFKLGEFLASGKIVVATQIGDVAKYLTNMENAILIKPDSIKAIEEAIIFILNNQKTARLIGKCGHDSALINFDAKKLTKQLIEILNNL